MPAAAEAGGGGVPDAISRAEEPTWYFVDNEDPGFQFVSGGEHGFQRVTDTWTSHANSAEAWWRGEDFLSTSAGWGDADQQLLSAVAVWTAEVPQGRYDVFVRVQVRPENTTMATYCIVRGAWHEAAEKEAAECYWLNQRKGESGWRHLAIVETPGTIEVWLDPGASIVGSGSILADSVAFRRIDASERAADHRAMP